MKNFRKTLGMFMALPLMFVSCELIEEKPEEPKEVVDKSTYTYSYTCPSGSKVSVPIPNRLSATCKKNWEYFARTYGCNDADNFAEANRRKALCP